MFLLTKRLKEASRCLTLLDVVDFYLYNKYILLLHVDYKVSLLLFLNLRMIAERNDVRLSRRWFTVALQIHGSYIIFKNGNDETVWKLQLNLQRN